MSGGPRGTPLDLRPPLDLAALDARARKKQHAPYIEAELVLALLAHCRALAKAAKELRFEACTVTHFPELMDAIQRLDMVLGQVIDEA